MKKVLSGGTIIDGTGAPPIQNGAVVFENSTITAVGPLDKVHLPETADIIDVSGKTVIPGLIDCHIHMDLHGYADTYDENLVEDKLRAIRSAKEMEATLRRGITTVRNVGSVNHIDFAVKEAIEAQLCQGPTVITCGKIISMTTRGNEYFLGLYREADGPDEVRKAAREQIKAGADFLKIMATGAVMNPGEVPGATQYSREEIEAVVEEANKLGLYVSAHAHGVDGITNAILSGVKTIEHGTFLDEKTIGLFLKYEAFLIPTYVVGYCMKHKGGGRKIPSFMRQKVSEQKHHFNTMLARAIAEGVNIAFGTDAGTPFNYHGNNALQLKLYVEDGFMSPVEAIRTGTLMSAKAIGWEDKIGTLKHGKKADIVVVNGSLEETLEPLLDSVDIVFKNGKLVT
jgi:imidazolonepropionase-like amidohydrolase